MRGLYPGQSANPGRNYSHPGMSSYHQHNLHRYQQVGKTRSNIATPTLQPSLLSSEVTLWKEKVFFYVRYCIEGGVLDMLAYKYNYK